MKCQFHYIIIVIGIIIYGIGQSWAGQLEKISVEIKEESWVKGDKIYLKDIALINAPAHINDRLQHIYLAYSPKPGKERKFNGSWLTSKITSELNQSNSIHIQSPETVIVTRASQVIADEKFETIFNAFIDSHMKETQSDYNISRFKVMGNNPVPVGDVKISLTGEPLGKIKGYISMNADIEVDKESQQKVILTAWIDRFENVVCTNHRIPRLAVITSDDISIQKQDVTRINEDYFIHPEEVIGKLVKRTTDSNTILTSQLIDRAPVIQKGDKVTIIAESQTLLVKAAGIAQTVGYIGEQIQVRNLMSKKNVMAIVVDSGTVKVTF